MSGAIAEAPPADIAKHLPPGPTGAKLYLRLLHAPGDWLGFLSHLKQDYGDICFFRIGSLPVCLVTQPEDIEFILLTHARDFVKSKDYLPLKAVLGNGLLTSEGDFWRRERQKVQPAFHHERIAAYANVMVEHTQKMIAAWRDGEIRNAHDDMTKLTLSIISKTLFDADVGSVAESVGHAMTDAMKRYADLAWLALFVSGTWLFRKTYRELDAVMYEVIRARRESRRDPGDLLSMLLQAQADDGSRMTDRQLRDEMITLFAAGHDTTANALAWTWYLLSKHPEIEERVHEEVVRVLNGRAPNMGDVPRLTYIQQVLKESLRLYPPAWGIGREALRDFDLAGYHLPAGTNIFISQWVTHRDPRLFEQADEFLPDRWENDFEKQLPKFAYFPFGGGPRGCIGTAFAMMELTLLVATIAQQFQLRLVPNHPVVPLAAVTLRPKHGLRVTVHKREK